MKLPVPISFDWDTGNLDKNFKKHKVHFREAEEVFFNKPLKVFTDEKHSIKEKRFVAYGISNKNRLLTIIFTLRDNLIRVISARNANKNERRIYAGK